MWWLKKIVSWNLLTKTFLVKSLNISTKLHQVVFNKVLDFVCCDPWEYDPWWFGKVPPSTFGNLGYSFASFSGGWEIRQIYIYRPLWFMRGISVGHYIDMLWDFHHPRMPVGNPGGDEPASWVGEHLEVYYYWVMILLMEEILHQLIW